MPAKSLPPGSRRCQYLITDNDRRALHFLARRWDCPSMACAVRKAVDYCILCQSENHYGILGKGDSVAIKKLRQSAVEQLKAKGSISRWGYGDRANLTKLNKLSIWLAPDEIDAVFRLKQILGFVELASAVRFAIRSQAEMAGMQPLNGVW